MKLKDQLKKKQGSINGKRRILFEVEAPPGSTVFVAGNFNWWDSTTHQLSDDGCHGRYRRHAYVEPGRIEYKFLVNGEWCIDPNCPGWIANKFGSLNSVTNVG